MKTVGMFYQAPGQVQLHEYEIGEPKANEIQAEVQVTGMCAYDLAIFKGFEPKGYAYPFLHGHEGVGIVRKVGSQVRDFHEGDKVALMGNAMGLFGHIANVSENNVAQLPQDAGHLENWIAEPVACVVNSLEWSKLAPGDHVAVVGAGFMGLLFVQALRFTLSQAVIAIDIDERRLELAKQFGATTVINSMTDEGRAQIAALKDSMDVVVESGGTQPTVDISTELVRPAGRLNIFGSHRGAGKRSVDLYEWHHKGIEVYNTSPKLTTGFTQVFRRTVGLMEKGVFDLKPLMSDVVPPENAQTLFESAVTGNGGYLKGAIKWSE